MNKNKNSGILLVRFNNQNFSFQIRKTEVLIKINFQVWLSWISCIAPKASVCRVKVGRSNDCLKRFFNLIYKNRINNIKQIEVLFQLKLGKNNKKHLLSRLGDMNRYIHNECKTHQNRLIYCFMILWDIWSIFL